jgi:hypothetical protein
VPDGRRAVELELTGGRIAVAAVVLLMVAAAGIYWLAGRGERRADLAGDPETTASRVETLPQQGAIFDRTGPGAAERDLAAQVTPEASVGARFELDLGTVPTRSEAERIKAGAAAAGITVQLAADAAGRYVLAAGPFRAEDDARRPAQRLTPVLGRPPSIRPL